MKLTQERARQLRAKGVRVDMTKIERKKSDAQSEIKGKDAPDVNNTYIESILEIAKSNEHNIKDIVQLNGVLVGAMEEIVKNKKPRNWQCTIGRNSRGEMETVDIKEK